MIPKIIHFCWLSDDPYPKKIEECIESWKKRLPDYEIRKWDFKRFPKGKSDWVREAFDKKKYAFAADYIRNYALYHEGGIYLDSDVEVIKSFDSLLHLPYFLGYENGSGCIEAAVMGAEPGHPVFAAILDYYTGKHFVKADGSLDTLPLPRIMSRVLPAKYCITPIDDPRSFDFSTDRISVLPYDYFSPIHLECRELQSTDRTVAIHRFAATWQPWHKKAKKAIKHIVGPKATRWFIRTKRSLLGRQGKGLAVAAAVAASQAFYPAPAQAESSTAQLPEITVSVGANLSTGTFAPYFISSLRHGKVFQKNTVFADVSVIKHMDTTRRVSWGAGAEVMASYANSTAYDLWKGVGDPGAWTRKCLRPQPVVVQQLYAEGKYRSVFLQAGIKEYRPALLNPVLSSGDFVYSGNARPIPQIRIGFHDFVDIPLTRGWLQIQGELAYGILTDYSFMSDRYNRYTDHINKGSYYNYKRCFFRTNPKARFSATFGMQGAGFFGGTTKYYHKGEVVRTEKFHASAKSLFNMLFPIFNKKETFAEGSNLGSWDFFARYRLNDGSMLCAYFQWPFEDGSGIARRNKTDGIWGFEYKGKTEAIVSGIVIEYIDFRDQSGPIHYAPSDTPGATITSEATGRDNYYNNTFYNSYAYYGMAIGTPFLPSPIYNTDGIPDFTCNRANGVHLGVAGTISRGLSYLALFGYQRGLGTYTHPYGKVRKNTSIMLEAKYNVTTKISVTGQLAIDRGRLRGDNTGGMVGVSYRL